MHPDGRFRFPVKILVDHGLRMFHTYPTAKDFGSMLILCFPAWQTYLWRCGREQECRFLPVFPLCIDNDCSKLPVTDHQISYCGTKTEFPAHFFNLMTHKLNDTYKLICAKMRLLLVKDLRGSSCLHKSGKNFPSSSKSIFYQSIQLSIGKSPCTALSELYIGIRIQDAVFQKFSTVFWRLSASSPRSSTSGQYPALARYQAQNNPAGPLPITIGRWDRASEPDEEK